MRLRTNMGQPLAQARLFADRQADGPQIGKLALLGDPQSEIVGAGVRRGLLEHLIDGARRDLHVRIGEGGDRHPRIGGDPIGIDAHRQGELHKAGQPGGAGEVRHRSPSGDCTSELSRQMSPKIKSKLARAGR